MLETDGKDSFFIIEIKVCENAREFEQKYLLKKYYDLGREEFLKTYINRNLSPGILLTEDIIRKANEKRKVSNSISAKKLLEEGKHNFQLKPAENYVHVIQKRSERMMGNKLGSLRKIDDELRKKLSEKSKGNKNVRDTKWWNDGKQRKRSKDCPGENWKEGYKIN
jgi:hypothetical protein